MNASDTTKLARRPLGPLLLLSLGLMACGQPTSTPPGVSTSTALHLEAEGGTIAPLAPQDIAEPRSGGKIIRDPGASGGQAVILLGSNDAVRFKLPGNFTPGRYTLKVQGRGIAYQGWPVVALENDRRQRMSTTTLDTPTYAPRGFGQFDLRPNQEMSVSFLNDRYDGPGKDRNAVVDSLLIEPVKTTPPPAPKGYAVQFGKYPVRTVPRRLAVDASDNAYLLWVIPDSSNSEDAQEAFLRKTDAQGRELWTRELVPCTSGVAVDAAGSSYVVGRVINGPLSNCPGQTSTNRADAFVRKYGPDGAEVWARQFGTPRTDVAQEVTVDGAGNIYVVGVTGESGPGEIGDTTTFDPTIDVFVRKFGADGTLLWTQTFGSPLYDTVAGISVDGAGNVYVGGSTEGAFPGQTSGEGFDAYVSKLSASGTPLWTRQFNGGGYTEVEGVLRTTWNTDEVTSLQADPSGNVYVAGRVDGTLAGQTSAGQADAFVRKYGPDGRELWTRQIGTAERDAGRVGLDPAGNVYLTVSPSQQSLAQTSSTSVRKYAPDGTLVQTRPVNLGIKKVIPVDMVVGRSGNIFLTGRTDEPLPGFTQTWDYDVFLTKLVP